MVLDLQLPMQAVPISDCDRLANFSWHSGFLHQNKLTTTI